MSAIPDCEYRDCAVLGVRFEDDATVIQVALPRHASLRAGTVTIVCPDRFAAMAAGNWRTCAGEYRRVRTDGMCEEE